MATKTFAIGDFDLVSSWSCSVVDGKLQFSVSPTTATKVVRVDFEIPSGSMISSCSVTSTINYPSGKGGNLNVNGYSFSNDGVATIKNYGATAVQLTFSFKGGGEIRVGNGSTTITFRGTYLSLEYEPGSVSTGGSASSSSNSLSPANFDIPPQSVGMFSQDGGASYLFDGVIKIQHLFSVKMEEEPEKHKEDFINSARNEPDKLALDVMMSDVYTSSSALVSGKSWDSAYQSSAAGRGGLINGTTRSGNAAYTLHRLKEQRSLFTIVTPQYVHFDMVIASVTITQDEECPNGWMGQIEFQHKYAPPPAENNNTSTAQTTSGGTSAPAPSVAAQTFGSIIGSSVAG